MRKVLDCILRRPLRDEMGGATVESVLWFPVFVVFLALIVDVSLIFNGQALVYKAIQDENRRFAVGTTLDTVELETRLTDRLEGLAPNAVASAKVVDGLVATVVTVPARDFSFSRFFDPLGMLRLNMANAYLIEDV